METQPKFRIHILYTGVGLYAFETFDDGVAAYPRVYMAWAMDEGSIHIARPGLKWINRSQFDWLIQHRECEVYYLGAVSSTPYIFICKAHQLIEDTGQDVSVIEKMIYDVNIPVLDPWDEERVI